MIIKKINIKNGETKKISFYEFIKSLEEVIKKETGINENYTKPNIIKINYKFLQNETIKVGEYKYSRCFN